MPKFSFDTIANFDQHISGSIKGYDLLDSLIVNVCSFYAKKNATIVDLGCTSGRLISKLADIYVDNTCVGYDITDHNFPQESKAKLVKQDIAEKDFTLPKSNIVLSVFTLQFLSYEDRIVLLRKIYRTLNANGVFILCEKEISKTGIFQEVFTFSNYDYKKANFTSEDILNKEVELRKIMNCLSIGQNEELLKDVGFMKIEAFFQSLNFRGWLCMK